MSLAKILIKSPKKIESFLNTIPIPIHAWQIHQNEMFLIDYNSAAYLETNGEIKNYLGSIAAEYYKENIELIDVLKESVDKSTSISKEIKYFCSNSNELQHILVKTDFIPPDLVLVQKINKTKQELLEQKVKKSEEMYFLITENAHDLIGVINRKFKFEYLNENSLSNILGYTTKEIIGKNILKFIHPEDVNLAIQKYSDGFEVGESIGEMRTRHKQGHYVWLELKGKSYTDHNGEKKGVIISRDITQRKLLEQRIKESEEKYHYLFEKSPYMIILINTKGDIIDFNQNTFKYLRGINKKDLIGKNFLDLNLIPSKHLNKLKRLYKDLFGEGFSIPLEFKMDSSKNNLVGTNLEWIEVQTAMLKVGDDNLIQMIIQDISERKRVEEKYIIAYDQAEFYKNLCTHDFSNILLVINGSSQICSLFIDDPEKVKEVKDNLERIRDQVKRANLLIKNIQKISEIDRNKPLLKLINICTPLTESIKYVNDSYKEKSVEINVNSSNDQFFVPANNLILDVFENILINAIKYNDKPNIKISVKISKIEKDNNNYVKLEFSDNGIGIQDSRKKLIFQEGRKRDKYTKGMGFGLTLVKTIIDSYDGQIWVEDRVPNDYTQGCNFVILIPTK